MKVKTAIKRSKAESDKIWARSRGFHHRRYRVGQRSYTGWPIESSYPKQALAILRHMAGERSALPPMTGDMPALERRMQALVLATMRASITEVLSSMVRETSNGKEIISKLDTDLTPR